MVRLAGGLAGIAAVVAGLRLLLGVANPTIAALTLLLIVLIVAATSRLWVALVAAIAAMFSFNYFFLPPLGTWTIADPQNWVALFVFLAVCVIASNLSAAVRARAQEAQDAAIERARFLEERKAAELTRQSEELKSALLASIGHDLRTPLTAIRVAASNLQGTWLSEAERENQTGIILTEVERLTRLFQNLLSMAKIDAGPVATAVAWAVPSEILAAAREQVEQTLRHHHLDVAISSDVPLRLDPRLTATALAHVLENAAHYSPAGATIGIKLDTTEGYLVITVHDAGPGISASDLPHLFDRFYRGAAARSWRSGTGMGLAIARGLLAAEKGRIWADNDAAGGAVFTISVPVEQRVAEPSEIATPKDDDGQRQRRESHDSERQDILHRDSQTGNLLRPEVREGRERSQPFRGTPHLRQEHDDERRGD
jgi:K+-sensing histidine kinase KdpD